MNRKSSGLFVSRAIEGFLQFKAAEALSPGTINEYRRDLEKWLAHMGDRELASVEVDHVRQYLAWLRLEYTPKRFGGNTQPLSPKTIRNVWISISAFFAWAHREFDYPDVMADVPAPRFKKAPFEPLKKDEVERLLKALEFSRETKTEARRKYVCRRPTAKRDRAMVLMLLDTGLRANELCSLKIGDIDIKTGKVDIKHGVIGGAKGGKGRVVFMGKSARRAIWVYLASREDGEDADAPAFVGKFGRPVNKMALRHLLTDLGNKAGIKKCHPHRFRHTFAITYLRSGGDVFTLQSLLGHGSLDMVQHYARIAQIDIENAHRRASPADNWRLG